MVRILLRVEVELEMVGMSRVGRRREGYGGLWIFCLWRLMVDMVMDLDRRSGC